MIAVRVIVIRSHLAGRLLGMIILTPAKLDPTCLTMIYLVWILIIFEGYQSDMNMHTDGSHNDRENSSFSSEIKSYSINHKNIGVTLSQAHNNDGYH